jgi:diadenosine tetraphosphate (Ap4A) HIT family hydrolase
MFELHPQLAKDCVVLGDFELSTVLLSKDSNYPWLILVPRRNGIKEIFELQPVDQVQLLSESSALSAALYAYFNADKMNVAALGNMVPQLHIHHIVRYQTDPAWPSPVWGAVAFVPYTAVEQRERVQRVQELLLPHGLIV